MSGASPARSHVFTVGDLARLLDKAPAAKLIPVNGKTPINADRFDPARLVADNASTPDETVGPMGLFPQSARLVAVDVDVPKGGATGDVATRAAWATERIGEPLTRCSTPSGGEHLFYAAPSFDVRNMTWRYGDVRGAAGFVVVYDLDAILYALDQGDDGAPPNLLALQDVPTGPQRASTPADLRDTPEGDRNNTLNAGVYADARAGRLDGARVGDWRAAAAAAGLDRSETERTIQSAQNGAERKPRPSRPSADPTGRRGYSEAAGAPERPPLDLDAIAPRLGDCSAVSEPVEWLWSGRIARGTLFTITGAPDAGKSLCGVAIGAAASTGLALPGDVPREPGRVVWIGAEDEDTHALVVARLRHAGADPARVRVFRAPEDPVQIAEVCGAIRQWKPGLVLIDSHVSWFRESNSGPDVRRELKGATGGLLRDGAAVGIVTHWRKGAVEDGPDHFRAAGSNMGIVGAVRSVLECEKTAGQDAGVLRTVKHNIGPQPDDVDYRIVGHGTGGLIGVVEWAGTVPHAPREPGGGGRWSDDDVLGAVDNVQAAGKAATFNRIKDALGAKNDGQRKALRAIVDRLAATGRLGVGKAKVGGRDRTIYEHRAASGSKGRQVPVAAPAEHRASGTEYVIGADADASEPAPDGGPEADPVPDVEAAGTTGEGPVIETTGGGGDPEGGADWHLRWEPDTWPSGLDTPDVPLARHLRLDRVFEVTTYDGDGTHATRRPLSGAEVAHWLHLARRWATYPGGAAPGGATKGG